jgi:hypothetical protein
VSECVDLEHTRYPREYARQLTIVFIVQAINSGLRPRSEIPRTRRGKQTGEARELGPSPKPRMDIMSRPQRKRPTCMLTWSSTIGK